MKTIIEIAAIINKTKNKKRLKNCKVVFSSDLLLMTNIFKYVK